MQTPTNHARHLVGDILNTNVHKLLLISDGYFALNLNTFCIGYIQRMIRNLNWGRRFFLKMGANAKFLEKGRIRV